ncbi:MAG: LytR C-terminal domain-containing protein [Desulfobulbaceae bacterium]|nr:LytR C-terminal domain-containing protein [Desulfobulbaceae bacterium]
MEIKIGKKQPVLMVCLIVSWLVFSGCSSKYFGDSGAGENDYKAMLSQFWANVRPVKDLAVSHYKLGRFYQQKGQHQKAIIEFKKAILSYPEYITAYNALGMSYDAVSDYGNAELAYSKAISINPKLAYLYNNLGYSYLCRGDHDSAVIYFEKAAHLDGQQGKINNNLQLARTRSIENKVSVHRAVMSGEKAQSQEQESLIGVTNEPVDESLETQTAEVESIVNDRTNVKEDNASNIKVSKQAEREVLEYSSLQLADENGSARINKVNSTIDSLSTAQNNQTPETNSESFDIEMNSPESQKVVDIEEKEVAAALDTPAIGGGSNDNDPMHMKADNLSDPSKSKQSENETQKIYTRQLVANTYSSTSNIKNSVIDSAPVAYYGQKPRVNPEQSDKGANGEQSQKENDLRLVGIEVVNGNGVNGMASRTAVYLEKNGLKVYKISNAQNFDFDKTKIFYKNGYLKKAYMVAKLIPGYQDFTKLNSLSSSNLHVQVILGRDTISSQHILR